MFDTSHIEFELCQWILSTTLFNTTEKRNKLGQSELKNKELQKFTLDSLISTLKLDELNSRLSLYEFRLRLAMHLAPVRAINWDKTNSESRVNVVKQYIASEFKLNGELNDKLAISVVKTLVEWEQKRGNVRDKLEQLIKSQSNRCNSCKVSFSEEAELEFDRKVQESGGQSPDKFKPLYNEKHQLKCLSKEVDHIHPISGYGNNSIDNLQVLCLMCNRGKDNGLGIPLVKEFENCYQSIEDIPWGHRARMFYNRLEIDNFKCTSCNSEENELTIRPVRQDGGFLLTNLVTICYQCSTS